jgi:Ca-activated chloride channel family protein
MTKIPNAIVTPLRAGLLSGSDNEVDVLIRVQAPDAPSADAEYDRYPLNLAVVIDRSGSMSGRPLEEAKRCAAHMIDGLRPSDRAALVVYDDRVDLLLPSTPVFDKDRFKTALAGVRVGGYTNLHGGWLKGAGEIAPHINGRIVSRVLLLSDGCANRGITNADAIFAQCSQLAEAGVSTSTYGVGNNFNELLMVGMARSGRGKSYYSDTADDLMDSFREEFALLSALCTRSLRLSVDLPYRGKVSVLNRLPSHPQGGCQLPDLAYGSEAWLVVRIAVPTDVAGTGDATPVTIASFQVDYIDRDGNPQMLMVPPLQLPSLSAANFSALTDDELVSRRVGELQAAELEERASRAASRGDWKQVNGLLAEASSLGQSNRWVHAVVNNLRDLVGEEERFAKESLFQAERMRTRLAEKKELAAQGKAGLALYLRRKTKVGKGEG